MLKWIVPPKNAREGVTHSPAPRPNSTGSVSSTSATSRVTDDPLAAIGIRQPKSRLYSKLSLPFGRKDEEIYSVTRVNPLFLDAVEGAEGGMVRHKSEEDDYLFLSDESGASTPTQRRSSSSSGYDSGAPPSVAVAADRHRYRPSTTSSSDRKPTPMPSADDYRRQFVLGGSLVYPKRPAEQMTAPVTLPRIGKANVLHQNGHFVTKVQMGDDHSTGVKRDAVRSKSADKTPDSATYRVHKNGKSPPAPVWPTGGRTGAPRRLEPTKTVIEQNSNYVTQILISPQEQQLPKWDTDGAGESNYDSIITDSLLMWMSYEQKPVHLSDSDQAQATYVEGPSASKSDEHAVRELSRTMSRSQTIATVSRAFSSSDSTDDRRSGPSSLSKGFLLMRDFWEKNGGNGRRLLVESDEDDTDAQLRTRYWTQDETLRPRFDPDRSSNSSRSSRSSGSRRVTFSADTVDNEPSHKSSNSSVPELHLNPVYLPRYQSSVAPQVVAASSRSEVRSPTKSAPNVLPIGSTGPARYGQNFYVSNLQMYSDRHADQSAKSRSSTPTEQQKMWESYYGAFSNTESHGNLQLHPNHQNICADSTVCMDFTLDPGNVSLIERRSVGRKLRRRLCCCVLLLLAVGVVILVVVGISLYLTHGQKYFGSI